MQNVVREDLDAVNAILTVHVTKDEYKPVFDKKLKTLRQKAQIKGFRKGQTPMSLVTKMYGQGLLVEVVQEEINQRLSDYLEKAGNTFLGQPLFNEAQEPLAFDLNDMKDYAVRFDLGITPSFELKGWDKSNVITIPEISDTEELINKQLELIRLQYGEKVELTENDTAQSNDIIYVHIQELKDGEVLENGHQTDTTFLLSDRIEDHFLQLVLGKPIGESFDFDPYTVEKNSKEDHVRKYILNLEDPKATTGRQFRGQITKIGRSLPAEMNADLFEKILNRPGATEEEVRLEIKDQVLKNTEKEIQEYVLTSNKANLMEVNDFPLPTEFLKKWFASRLEEDQQKPTKENSEQAFLVDVKWTLIREKLLDKMDLTVTDEEIKDDYGQKIRQYLGGQADEQMIASLKETIMNNKEMAQQIAQEISNRKTYEACLESLDIRTESVHSDAYSDWMNNAYDKLLAQFNSMML
jgi:trigger factor